MTPDSPCEDPSRALHTDGYWHIIVKSKAIEEIVGWVMHVSSVVYHNCPKSSSYNDKQNLWTLPVQYRISSTEMDIQCMACHEDVPESIRGLWMLHNFDSIQSTGNSHF